MKNLQIYVNLNGKSISLTKKQSTKFDAYKMKDYMKHTEDSKMFNFQKYILLIKLINRKKLFSLMKNFIQINRSTNHELKEI